MSNARSAVSTGVTSLFGRIRTWTATDEEEEPYMPASDTANQSDDTKQKEVESNPKTDQSDTSSKKEAESKPQTDQSGTSSQKEAELKPESDPLASLGAGDAEGLGEVSEVKVHEAHAQGSNAES